MNIRSFQPKSFVSPVVQQLYIWWNWRTPSRYVGSVIISALLLSYQCVAQPIIHINTPQAAVSYRVMSDNGSFELLIEPQGVIRLNQLHHWRATITAVELGGAITASNDVNLINSDNVIVTGGMPKHGHGLPTQPNIGTIVKLRDNKVSFLIQGLKFQMFGPWVINISVTTAGDIVRFNFEIRP